jgi:hypothetical protein
MRGRGKKLLRTLRLCGEIKTSCPSCLRGEKKG